MCAAEASFYSSDSSLSAIRRAILARRIPLKAFLAVVEWSLAASSFIFSIHCRLFGKRRINFVPQTSRQLFNRATLCTNPQDTKSFAVSATRAFSDQTSYFESIVSLYWTSALMTAVKLVSPGTSSQSILARLLCLRCP